MPRPKSLEPSNLIGKKFQMLTLLDKFEYRGAQLYFLVQCDCGTQKFVQYYSMARGATKACGCLQSKSNMDAGAARVYNNYLSSAKARNLTFDIPKDIFVQMLGMDCYYCGKKPSLEHKKKSGKVDLLYNGLDRRNNELGYTLENCVTCCKECNYFKKDRSEETFLELCKNVYLHQNGNKYD